MSYIFLYILCFLKVKMFHKNEITTAFTSWILETTKKFPLVLSSRMLIAFHVTPGKYIYYRANSVLTMGWVEGSSIVDYNPGPSK